MANKAFQTVQWLARRILRTRSAYNLARRGMLIGNRILGIPHEQDFRLFAAFRDLKGPIIDVGANGGQSIISFSAFMPKSVILSFEPNPDLHSELRFVQRWLKSAPAELIPYALGEADGQAVLEIPQEGSLPIDARASMATANTEGASQITVDVRRFDGLVLDILGDYGAPEIVKVDVEGFEAPVMRGMTEMLGNAQPLVLFERSDSLEDVSGTLLPLGYELFTYNADRNRLEPFDPSTTRINVFALSPDWKQRCADRGLL